MLKPSKMCGASRPIASACVGDAELVSAPWGSASDPSARRTTSALPASSFVLKQNERWRNSSDWSMTASGLASESAPFVANDPAYMDLGNSANDVVLALQAYDAKNKGCQDMASVLANFGRRLGGGGVWRNRRRRRADRRASCR